MGRGRIADKLGDEFAKGIECEAQVVYVLVEIRKLLEITHRATDYPALVFHCDWAVHSKMNRAGALAILQRFDNYCEKAITLDPLKAAAALDTEIGDIIGGEKFQTELKAFLKSVHVDIQMDLQGWFQFLKLYSRIIMDTPLTIKKEHPSSKLGSAISIKHLILQR
jgi:hypothetical protein